MGWPIAGLLSMLAAGAYLTGPGGLVHAAALLWLGLLYRHAIITTPLSATAGRGVRQPDPAHLLGDEPSAIADFPHQAAAGQDPHRAPGGWTMRPSPAGSGGPSQDGSREGRAPTSPSRTSRRQVATAITEMAATAHEIARNIQETDNQIAQAKGALPAYRSAAGGYPAQGQPSWLPRPNTPSRRRWRWRRSRIASGC